MDPGNETLLFARFTVSSDLAIFNRVFRSQMISPLYQVSEKNCAKFETCQTTSKAYTNFG